MLLSKTDNIYRKKNHRLPKEILKSLLQEKGKCLTTRVDNAFFIDSRRRTFEADGLYFSGANYLVDLLSHLQLHLNLKHLSKNILSCRLWLRAYWDLDLDLILRFIISIQPWFHLISSTKGMDPKTTLGFLTKVIPVLRIQLFCANLAVHRGAIKIW